MDFQLEDTRLGNMLTLLATGAPATQTPIIFDGAGPFALTGDQLETALQSALIFTGTQIAPISLVMPNTTTILNLLSNASVNTSINPTTPFLNTNQTYGAWQLLKVINQSTQTVNVVAGDVGTSVTQYGVQPLSSQLFTIFEVLTIDTSAQVSIVQNIWRAVPTSEFFTIQNTASQVASSATAYLIQFTSVFNVSPTTDEISFSLASPPNNFITIVAGTTALISAACTVLNTSTNPLLLVVQIAPAGQTTAPLTGVISGINTTAIAGFSSDFSLTMAYTNNTASPTSWSLYLSGHDTVGGTTQIVATANNLAQFTVTEIPSLYPF